MAIDDRLDDRETEAGAALLRAEEGVEDSFHLSLWNSRSLVFDGDRRAVVIATHSNSHFSALGAGIYDVSGLFQAAPDMIAGGGIVFEEQNFQRASPIGPKGRA